MNNNSIYIFTCNRPIKLEKLLNDLCSIKNSYGIFIIDDSCRIEAVKENKKIVEKYTRATYLGTTNYTDFYKQHGNYPDGYLLGSSSWNLGIARNFAFDHSLYRKSDKILFVDDDISGIKENIIEHGFTTLTKNRFVSCNLKGVEDNSIIGHIAKKVGVKDDGLKMLSGGFLFLAPASLSHRFYNIYNEDWIIQLLEKEKERILLPYSVQHNVGQQLKWTPEQVLFQEPGELIVEALLENSKALSLSYTFWDRILENRIKFIEEIEEASLKTENHFGHVICGILLKWLKQHNGISFHQLIENKIKDYNEYKI